MITFKQQGNFSKTDNFLKGLSKLDIRRIAEPYAREGVRALAEATPIDTGTTASSWEYTIDASRGSLSITWTNRNLNKGIPVAVLIQYGHATKSGGFVEGIDFINPALKPIFDQLTEELWREVTRL